MKSINLKTIANAFIFISKMTLWLFQPFLHILLCPLLYFIISNFCFVPQSKIKIGNMNRLSVFLKWVLDFIILLAFYIIGWYVLNASWVDMLFEGIYGLFGTRWLFGIPNLIFCFGCSFVCGTMFLWFVYRLYIIMNEAINEFCGTEHTSIQAIH